MNVNEVTMVIMKKRQILIVALSLVVVIAAYLNWTYTENGDESVTVTGDTETKTFGEETLVDGKKEEKAEEVSTKGTTYFESARLTRDKARSDAIDTLRTVAESDSASNEEKDLAYTSIRKSAENTEKEGNIENLLKAKAFSDVLVYITDDSVSVTVKTEGLTTADTAKIFDIVVAETGISSEKIKIIEIK